LLPEPHSIQGAALAEVEAEIEHACANVEAQFDALRHEIVETIDWHRWVQRHPAAFLGVAFGLGFAIGRRL
jgi:hypothetical protein